jgi:hypothetical protein
MPTTWPDALIPSATAVSEPPSVSKMVTPVWSHSTPRLFPLTVHTPETAPAALIPVG